MTHESFTASFTAHTSQAEAAEVASEIPDYGYFLETFGLGPQEVDARAEFGQYSGTVAAMLTDERCPVGRVVADAYQAEGIEGVANKLNGLSALDGKFMVPISETTQKYHAGAIARDELLKRPDTNGEEPHFLA